MNWKDDVHFEPEKHEIMGGQQVKEQNFNCDDCGGQAHDLLITPNVSLCFNCWDMKETPQETIERLNQRDMDNVDMTARA